MSIIRTEVPADDARQLHVIIDSPSARNGVTREAMAAMAEIIDQAAADPAVRCIVLRGAGDHFCAGADLRSAGGILKDGADGMRRVLSQGYHAALKALFECPKPTLAVIRGAAVGFGFDLSLAADLRLSAHDAMFAQVFVKLGLVPDGGSSFTLPRLVGLGKAMEMMLLGDRIDGREAERLGIVNRAVPGAELDQLAADWARRLADGPPIAYRLGKANLRAGAAGGDLAAALHREQEAQAACALTRDALAGAQAFFLKQPPKFEGR